MKESRMENLFNNSIVLHHEAVRQKEQKKTQRRTKNIFYINFIHHKKREDLLCSLIYKSSSLTLCFKN